MNGQPLDKICPLCLSVDSYLYSRSPLQRSYYHCRNCDLIFVDSENFISVAEQKLRYDFHENSIDNKGYVRFLNQAIEPAIPYLPPNGLGLDYGSGPNSELIGSVLSRLLQEKGYSVLNYDPIYQPDIDGEKRFDFIFSTEVWEHFTQPAETIGSILSMLNYSGILIVMTTTWYEELDFSNWYYAKDDTHTSFYHHRTINWIARNYNLEILKNPSPSVWIFRKMGSK